MQVCDASDVPCFRQMVRAACSSTRGTNARTLRGRVHTCRRLRSQPEHRRVTRLGFGQPGMQRPCLPGVPGQARSISTASPQWAQEVVSNTISQGAK